LASQEDLRSAELVTVPDPLTSLPIHYIKSRREKRNTLFSNRIFEAIERGTGREDVRIVKLCLHLQLSRTVLMCTPEEKRFVKHPATVQRMPGRRQSDIATS
jgi:hypothetical protein